MYAHEAQQGFGTAAMGPRTIPGAELMAAQSSRDKPEVAI